MPDRLTALVPLKDIQRIQIYVNTACRSLYQIQRETGADYILNGTLYNMNTFAPLCHLKADGKVLCQPNYTVSGYAWNKGPDISTDTLPDESQRNYIACTPLIVSGKAVGKLIYDAGQGGKRGRTAIGVQGQNLALYCSKDGSSFSKTPEALRDELAADGWESAVMLDGGGSSQCYFQGETVKSTRAVHNLILVYLKGSDHTSRKVCLDPGHDAGNLANKSPDGTYYEHEFALDMGKRIQSTLERHGVSVTTTRPDGGAVSLAERCNIANGIKDLDLFVSLHSNAAGGSGWSSASGWSAYVYKTSGNGYEAAKDILEAVKSAGIAVRSTPIVADSSLYVLKGTVAPAVLIEHGFHTNQSDVAKLKDGSYREKLAEAEAKGILNYLGIAWKEPEKEETVVSETELAVQWVQDVGIMQGNASGDMMLDSPPTRRQIAIMLYRFAKLLGKA